MEDKDEEISIDLKKVWDKVKSAFKEEDPDKGKGIGKGIEYKTQQEEALKEQVSRAAEEVRDSEAAASQKAERPEKEPKIKKDPAKEVEKEAKAEQQDDEISLDFGKIKRSISGFFKGVSKSEKSEETGERESEDIGDVAVDFKAIYSFIRKHAALFIVLIPIILAIYIRAQPAAIPITDQWAADTVFNNIRSNIRAQIDQQYPNLPDANKNALVETQLQGLVQQNKAQIDAQIAAVSSQFKSFFQDEEGKLYMPDIDPYYWFRYSKNIIEKGAPGDEIRDGRQLDNHQLAPIGRAVVTDMYHAYFLAYFHKFLSFFNRNLELMRSMMYYPLLVSAASVLLAFLIGRKIAGNVGGFFSAFALAVNTSFVGRTLFGHADSDAWVVFFPMVVTWLFMECFESLNLKRNILFSSLAGLFVGLFSFSWAGWFFIFDFIMGIIGITIVYYYVTHFNELKFNIARIIKLPQIKNMIVIGIVFLLSSGLFVTLFSNFDTFKQAFSPFGFAKIKDPVRNVSLWPNVLTTVAELNEGSYNQVVESVGGRLIWFMGLAGILLSLLKKDVHGKRDIKYVLLLGFWVAASSYATLKGIRFTLLLAPPFAIAFGTALGFILRYASKWASTQLHINKLIVSSVLFILLIMPLISIANASLGAARSDLPLINDTWYNSLIKIRQNSDENAIITSWWDFGHHFKAIADRPVTFDGTTQDSPNSHWVGRLFMTSNEEEAIGILRMIDCGQDKSYNVLMKKTDNNLHKSLGILRKIILLDGDEAKNELINNDLTSEEAEEVLQYTHCKAPQAFAIASQDMIGKSGVWGHFGSWNFERGDIWFNTYGKGLEEAVRYMQEKFNYTRERAESTYYEVQSLGAGRDANTWIAPWPGYGGTTRCRRNNNTESAMSCDNGFQINLTSLDASAVSQGNVVHPEKMAYPTEEGVEIKEYSNNTVGLGMALVPAEENNFLVVLSSPELTGGMFTRMFYMNGHGLRYFDLFSHERGLTGTEVYVYTADWDGKNMTLVDEYVENMEVREAKEEISEKEN